ncbi:hypothetical protein [Arcanobacterium haemolyticum]
MFAPAYRLEEVSVMTNFSVQDLKLAITQNYETVSNQGRVRLPRLRAKRGKRREYLVLNEDLQAWLEQLPDA